MKKYITGFLLVFGLLVIAGSASASSYDWHFNLRNATDTADVPFDLNVGVNNRDRMVAVRGSTLEPVLMDFGENFWWDYDNLQLRLFDLPQSKVIGLISELSLKISMSNLTEATTTLQSNIDSINYNLSTYIASSSVQRTRVQTMATGAYTWTYPTAFATGTVPVLQLTVEDGTAGNIWNHRIVSISSTSTTIQLTKSTSVTLLGISVLGVASNPQAYVHMTAISQ